MKKYFSLAIVIVLLTAYACQQDELPETDAPLSNDPVTSSEDKSSASLYPDHRNFSRKVGKTISHQTGETWIDNYRREVGRNSPAYVLNAKIVKDLLQNPVCIGISLHFAEDNTGKVVILPITVDQDGKRIKTDIVVTQSGSIDWLTAQQWMDNYKGAVDAHFFGADTFSRLLTEDAVEIHLTEALDDRNKRQLLLRKGKAKGNSDDDDDYEDGSWPCPPMCP